MNKREYPLYECGFEVQPTWDNVYFIKAFDFFRRFASRLKINPPSFYEFENAMVSLLLRSSAMIKPSRPVC